MPTVMCSGCGKGFRVPDDAAGKRFKCKNCGGVIAVPGIVTPATSASATASSINPTTAAAQPRKAVTPPPLPTAPAYTEPDPGGADWDALASLETSGVVDHSIPFSGAQTVAKPVGMTRASGAAGSKPVKERPRFSLGFNISRLPILAIAIGVGLVIWGGKETLLASSSSAIAQDITCAQLASDGPGNNAHVRVTDFKSMSNFVFRPSANGEWETVWLPIVPPDAVKVPAGKHLIHPQMKVIRKELVDSSMIHVLIKTHVVHSQADVDGAMRRDSVEGLVINKIEKLNQKERDLFQNSYPMMDVDKVYIVEEGRQPAGSSGMLGLIGGSALILVGLVIIFKPVS